VIFGVIAGVLTVGLLIDLVRRRWTHDDHGRSRGPSAAH